MVKDGDTCDRCGATQAELRRALAKLERALRPLGIEPTLEVPAIDEATFRAEPLDSDRVWSGGCPLEAWLGAAAGRNRYRAACGGADCRAVEPGGRVIETN